MPICYASRRGSHRPQFHIAGLKYRDYAFVGQRSSRIGATRRAQVVDVENAVRLIFQ
jgi:hypothetical protein